ncbi:LysM peptidoglycan-binding domain-containing protein [Cellulomonas xylanilytica]|uniref:LysM domain-containing protein n=1 Tax=Cellulomonas xylanilytica TaxID=233583 RepID=A0A510V8K5_9CELL|nr:LysM domain-containing protein [Cellulomonas xylanilytica]GEK21600.1 hypothetical protein CXY01_21200 [Cellulomonas xylanilytica]
MAVTGEQRAGVSIGGLVVGALASATVAAVLASHVRTVLGDQAGPWHVDAVVEVAVVAVGALIATWLAASTLLATACVAVRAGGTTWRAGERLVHRCAPQVVRKALVLAVGAGLGLGLATGASAAAVEPSAKAAVTTVAPTPDLGWAVTTPGTGAAAPGATAAAQSGDPAAGVPETAAVPGASDTPTTAAAQRSEDATATSATASAQTGHAAAAAPTPVPEQAAATTPPGDVTPAPAVGVTATGHPRTSAPASAEPAPTGTVVVAAGDSLWAIAARHLPPGASDAQIAASWPRWYEENSAVIGADPDVVRPGQVLTVPVTVGEPAL